MNRERRKRTRKNDMLSSMLHVSECKDILYTVDDNYEENPYSSKVSMYAN